MFRPRQVFLLAIVTFSSFFGRSIQAQDVASAPLVISGYRAALDQESAANLAASIVASSHGIAIAYEAGAGSGLVAGYVIRPTGAAIVRDPPIAIVAQAQSVSGTPWPEAAWLAVLQRLVDSPPPQGALVLLIGPVGAEHSAHVTDMTPGAPLVRGAGIMEALADARIGAIILLDIDGPSIGARLDAESRGHQSPRQTLTLVRKAASSLGLKLRENPVGGMYAVAGLSAGNPALAPWLEAGLPAVALGSVSLSGQVEQLGEADYVSLIAAVAQASGAIRLDDDRDTNYFRYPLPSGAMTISDRAIVSMILGSALMIALAGSLGPLRRKPISGRAVIREAAMAILLALAAIVGAHVLVEAAQWLALRFGLQAQPLMAAIWMQSILHGIILGIRLTVALAVFYAVSGLLSRLGLHATHGRYEASVAALMLLCIDALVAMAVMPALVPMLLLSMFLVMMAARNAAGAMLGLFAISGVMLPFVDPRIITGLHQGVILVSLFAAPFGLWVVAATSSATTLRRGRSTALVWVAIAVTGAACEAVIRVAAG
ncbi:MAG TPA: hypothetical protein VMX33_02210 [bacterium]|nr:hypothetical protein [bacterium]